MDSSESRPWSASATSSLRPARSGAPPSSTLRWAPGEQITASQGRVRASTEMTLAPVPLKTGKARAASPNSARMSSWSRSVHGSSP